jgi:hypothetical protein
MRTFTIAMLVVILSAMAMGQAGGRGIAGYCPYGCGPYVPLITTPMVSFQTVSSSPVGATNATGGLQAGARNSTLSMISGDTDAVHTEAVWYSGGDSPIVARGVRLPHVGPMEMHEEHGEHARPEAANANWTYFSGRMPHGTPVEAAAMAKSAKHATRTYTNDDVARVAAKAEPFTKK